MHDPQELLPALRRLHAEIRTEVVAACERAVAEELSAVADDREGDTIFAIDRVSERALVAGLEAEARRCGGIVLIAEGVAGGRITLGAGEESRARWRVIVDPIDGTRGIMYQKRSAWILTGVAPNRGDETDLTDIVLALQTEIPLLRQHLSDAVWATRDGRVEAERFNRISGQRRPIRLQPSLAKTIVHGYAMLTRFFPGARDALAEIEEEVVRAAVGPVPPGKAVCFEDQYASTGGQLYELMAGRDRFNADLRPLMAPVLASRGEPLGLCCHPYDICTELIARNLGVIVTDARGEPLRAPLAVEPDIAWIAYANPDIRALIEPHLQAALRRRQLI